ncbi:hypothetical protein FRB95_001198 [Tulasnella sp. JGI-2019a]|nr:hypothetical protein FRB95_001198 [Tulasnella sp. JGI-2019a]
MPHVLPLLRSVPPHLDTSTPSTPSCLSDCIADNLPLWAKRLPPSFAQAQTSQLLLTPMCMATPGLPFPAPALWGILGSRSFSHQSANGVRGGE